VRDLNNRRPRVVESLEELHNFIPLSGVKIARRLISKNELGILDYGAGHTDQLLLSSGQLIGKKILFADNAEAVQRVTNQAGALLVWNIPIGQRNLQVFVYREVIDQVVALKYEADIVFVKFVALLDDQLVNRLIEKKILA